MTSTIGSADAPMTDTSDMKGLHLVFRHALSLAPALVGQAAVGDKERAEQVGTYYFNVLRLLYSHHAGEDELVWPKLKERCPAESALAERMGGQHQEVVTLIGSAADAVQAWSTGASPRDAEHAVTTLAALDGPLSAHLQEEEDLVLPLCAQYLTPQEWGELPAHGMRTFDGDKPWLILGLVREQMTPAQLAAMDANMPPPVRQMWAQFGQATFEAFITQLRAPLAV